MDKNQSIKFHLLIVLTIYILMLNYAYLNIVVKYWGYYFPIVDENAKLVYGFCALLPLCCLDLKKETFSNYVINILYFVSYIPGCVLMGYVATDFQYKCVFYIYWIILFGLNKLSPYYKHKIKVDQRGNRISEMMLFFFCIVIIVVWMIYANARVGLALKDIYVVRMEARRYNMPVILNYLFAFSSSLIRIGIMFTLCKREWMKSIILSIVGIFVYFIEGSKGALFSVFLAWGVFFGFCWINKERIWLYVVHALNFIGIISIALFFFFDMRFPVSVYFQRMLFVPPAINIYYYDYFSIAEKDYFRQGMIGRVFGLDSPYKLELPRLIGQYAFNNVNINANTGLMGDAYANLGWIGILVMPVLVLILLRVMDICMKGMPIQMYVFVGILMSLYLLSSSFFTIFLSNGIIVMAVYLLISGRFGERKRERKFKKVKIKTSI